MERTFETRKVKLNRRRPTQAKRIAASLPVGQTSRGVATAQDNFYIGTPDVVPKQSVSELHLQSQESIVVAGCDDCAKRVEANVWESYQWILQLPHWP
ncbi:MAG: hypothetical protein Aurels2KO_19900 [Aureliella sp.]